MTQKIAGQKPVSIAELHDSPIPVEIISTAVEGAANEEAQDETTAAVTLLMSKITTPQYIELFDGGVPMMGVPIIVTSKSLWQISSSPWECMT